MISAKLRVLKTYPLEGPPAPRHAGGPGGHGCSCDATRQRRELARRLGRLRHRIEAGRLKQRDKMVQCLGRLKAKFP
ncbi:MAG: hypothetical protein HY000_33365, partial [Planctomycetes bacterium]|nr:hypothetical protein [Planctomycetota bacterium]